MPHVPGTTRTRTSHRSSTRPTHSHTGYLPALTGASEVYEQIAIDGVYGEQNILPGSLQPSRFPAYARPVVVLGTLPTLPDAGYPEGAMVVLLPGGTVYRNVADAWTAAVGAVSGGIEPVATLPALPNASYPGGAVVFLTTDDKLYRNDDGAWSRAVDGADLIADTVTTNAIAAGAITAAELAAFSVTAEKLFIQDSGGRTVLTGAGFGGSWIDFLASRLYNGSFASGTLNDIVAATAVGGADTVAEYDASLSVDLPYWIVGAESGTGTLRRVADGNAVGGAALQWDGVEDATIYQDVPVTPGVRASALITWRYTNSSSSFSFMLTYSWRDATHAIIGSSVGVGGAFSTSQATYLTSRFATTNTVAPSGARYLRVEVNFARQTGSPTIWLDNVQLSMGVHDLNIEKGGITFREAGVPTQVIISAAAAGDTYSRFMLSTNGRMDLGPGDAPVDAGLSRPAVNTLSLANQLLRFGGTTFPTGPSSGDIFYRTDHGLWFFYDGVRWVTAEEFSVSTTAITTPADGDRPLDVAIPFSDADVLWTRARWTSLVLTTNDGSNFWTAYMVDIAADGTLGSTHQSPNTSADGTTAYVGHSTNINAVIAYSSRRRVAIQVVKTGAPGVLNFGATIFYRRIAT